MKKIITTIILTMSLGVYAETPVTKDSSGWIGNITGIYRGGDSVPEEGISLNNGGKIVIMDPQGVNIRSAGEININGVSVKSNGQIKNVTAGTDAKDAVNKSQLDTKANQSDLATEVLKRQANVKELQNTKADKTELTSEVNRLDGRINDVGAAISNETTNRINADKALSTSIDVTNTHIKSEVSQIDTRINSTNQHLSQEISRIDQDIATHTEQIEQNKLSIESERSQRVASDVALNRHINGLGAMTMAANAVTHTATNEDKKTSLGVGVGSYGGETALAFGLTHTRNTEIDIDGKKTPVIVKYGATVSKSRASRTGVGFGASLSF